VRRVFWAASDRGGVRRRRAQLSRAWRGRCRGAGLVRRFHSRDHWLRCRCLRSRLAREHAVAARVGTVSLTNHGLGRISCVSEGRLGRRLAYEKSHAEFLEAGGGGASADRGDGAVGLRRGRADAGGCEAGPRQLGSGEGSEGALSSDGSSGKADRGLTRGRAESATPERQVYLARAAGPVVLIRARISSNTLHKQIISLGAKYSASILSGSANNGPRTPTSEEP